MAGNNVLINIKVAGDQAKKALNSINAEFIAIGATLTLLGRDISKTAMEFEKAMRNFNSIAQESEESLANFAERAREVAVLKEVQDTATGVAKAMYQLVSSGIEASKTLDIAAVAAKSASAGLTKTETAVKGLAGLMNAYNQKTLKDSIQFSDQLFKVVDQGVVSFEELSNNLGSVNAVAAAAKVDFKEVGASFIELTRAGISASESETSIANLIRSISSPSKEAAATAKLLGVELSDTALRTKGLGGVMKELSEASGGSLSVMQEMIPEARAAKAALTLAKDGAEGFDRALDSMNDSAGATQKALKEQMKSFAFTMNQLKANMEDLKISFGSVLNDALKPFIEYIQDFIKWLGKLDPETKKIIVQVGAFTVALGAAALATKVLFALFAPFTAGAGLLVAQLALVVGVLYATKKAVDAAMNSSNILINTLGGLADAFLEIVGAKDAINFLKDFWKNLLIIKDTISSMYTAHKQETEALETKEKTQKRLQDLYKKERQLKAENKKLSVEEQQELAKLNTQMITFVDQFGSRSAARKKAYSDEALTRKKTADEMIKAEEDKAKRDKEISDQKALDAQKKLDDARLKAEKEEEAEKEADRKRKERVRERQQALRELEQMQRQTTDNIKQNELSEYDYKKFLLDRELNDKVMKLAEISENNIDVSEDIKRVWEEYHSNIRKLDSETAEKQRKLIEQRRQQEEDASNFIKGLRRKINEFGADEKQQSQSNLDQELESLKTTAEAIKSQMSKLKDSTGKNLFSEEKVKEQSKALTDIITTYAEKAQSEVNKIGNDKIYKDRIKKEQEAIEELTKKDELTIGARLKLQKQYQSNILQISKEALNNSKNLTEQSVTDFKNTNKEMLKDVSDTQYRIDKIRQNAPNIYRESIKQIADATGLFSSETTQSFSNIIGNVKEVTKTFKIFEEEGLQGIQKHVEDGGSIAGLVGMATLLIQQIKGIGAAIADNLKPVESFEDFLQNANGMMGDLIKTITLGLVDQKGIDNFVKKLFGQATDEEVRRISQLQIESIEDTEERMIKSYELQKQQIKDTVSNTEERNLKLKVLEQNHAREILNLNKSKSDMKIDLMKDEDKKIDAWYQSERSFILQSEKNWEIRNLKLEKLSMERFQKEADRIIRIQKLENDFTDGNEVQELLENLSITLAEIDKNTEDATENQKKKLLETKKAILELRKIQENYFTNLSSIMSKYYEKERREILDSKRLELEAIEAKKKEISKNEERIEKLRRIIQEIESRYSKLLGEDELGKSAKTQMSADVKSFRQDGSAVSLLESTEVSEFERSQKAKVRELNFLLSSGEITAGEHAEEMKKLAVRQNIYWTEISKDLVKGTREYDKAVSNAMDAFDLYKSAVKDSLTAQKEAEIQNYETKEGVIDLRDEIDNLNRSNHSLKTEMNSVQQSIDNDLSVLDDKFKTVTGDWKTELSDVRTALGGIGTGAKDAINELDKLIETQRQAKEQEKKMVKDISKPLTESNIVIPKNNQLQQKITESDRINKLVEAQKAGVSAISPVSRIGGKIGQISKTTSSMKAVSSGISAVKKQQDPGLFGKGGGLGFLNPFNWFGDGGVVGKSGPEIIGVGERGVEAVVNGNQVDNFFKILNNPQSYAPTGGGNTYQTVNVNGSNLSESQLTKAVQQAFKGMEQQARLGYQR